MNTLGLPGKKSVSGRLNTTLLWLSQHEPLWQTDLEDALRLLTCTAARALNAGQISIWEYSPGGHFMYPRTQYHRADDRFSTPHHLERRLYPQYFQALESHRVICANDAVNDYRTCEFRDDYLLPGNIQSLLDAPLRQRGRVCGALCVEHLATMRIWSKDEQNFVAGLADLVSQLMLFYRLNESELRHRALFDSTRDAIILIKDGAFIDCNKAAEDLFQLSADMLIGRSPRQVSPLQQPDGRLSGEAAEEKIRAALAGIPQFFTWQLLRADGRSFEAEVNLEQVTIGTLPYLQAIVRDVTARNRADRAIRMIAQGVSARGDASFFEQMVTHLAHNFEAQCAFIARIDPQRHDHFRTVAVCLGQQIVKNTHYRIPDSAFEHLLSEGGCLIGSDARSIFPDDHMLTHLDAESFLGIPFHDSTGQPLGFVAVIDSKPIDTDPQHKEILEIFAARAGSELERLGVQDKLMLAADYDSLTGLPNRRRLHEEADTRIHNALREGRPLALFLLDLDRFKEVNDTLGHHMGDQLLIQVGARLRETLLDSGAMLCRLGGDEFAVLAHDIVDTADATRLARRLSAALSAPFAVSGIALSLGGSLGIALYPEHGDNSHALLRCADVAMYHAKHIGCGYSVYEAAQDAHSPRRLRMMTELGNAIASGQLELHYQPKMDLDSGLCIGCEALARWDHPVLGIISPAEFIPLAEMSDAIHALSLFVVESALTQLAQWDRDGLFLSIAINISARNLLDLNFADKLAELIQTRNISGERLEIEITESALISDPERALGVISRIAELGVKFSIDDFGTGYSSLSYLKRLPIDALKIDRSFVQEMVGNEQDSIIVRSTVSLAHNLGIKVVAEGVEDRHTLEQLRQLGCDMAQGFQISPALPHRQFESWIRQQYHAWEPSLA